jgi:hypothetical protein
LKPSAQRQEADSEEAGMDNQYALAVADPDLIS